MNAGSIGVVLAGGLSRRYGAPKALATVAGRPIVERVVEALAEAVGDVVVVANEPELYASLGLEIRADARPGAGVLGGILTAARWAGERGRAGALIAACDMPFLSVPLLRRLLEVARAGEPAPPDVVTPESEGRRGVEPLCAWYAARCHDAIIEALERGDRRVIGFWDDVRVARIPLDDVRTMTDPATAFLNVNTPEDRERAERVARGAAP